MQIAGKSKNRAFIFVQVLAALFCFGTGVSSAASIALVQHASVNAGSVTNASISFASPNATGNWIGVVVRGGNSSSQVFAVSDSNGNAYHLAVQLGSSASQFTTAIYYAENIKAGGNTVSVSQTVLGPLRVAVLEYSGVAASSSLDGKASGQGTSPSATSGNFTTTANGDLLLAAVATTNGATFTASSGYAIEELVPAEPSTKLIAENQIQSAAGSATAGAALAVSDDWVVSLAAFKAAAGDGSSAPPTISALSPSSGPVGTAVAISGANFGASQGTSSVVTFNGTAATPTSWSATSIVVPVPSAATTGSVVVSAGGMASNSMPFTVTATPARVALGQRAGINANSVTSTSLGFSNPNSAGNWIAVVVRAGGSSSQAFSVRDTSGNTYHQAFQLGVTADPITVAVYYAENIKGGSNTVTVSDSVSGPLRVAILEYSGVATSNSLDMTATAQGSGATPNSGNLTTGANGDLLLGEVVTNGKATFTAGAGYTIEESVPAEPNTKLIAEDQIQAAAGTASASASLATADTWAAGLAAFKAAAAAAGSSTVPTIASLSPTSGSVGTSVTINGTNFGSTNYAVTFNGTVAAPTSWTATKIVAPVPAGASSGNVVVSVGGAASNGMPFSVSAAAVAPSISGQPASVTVVAGQTATFSVAATGTSPLTYQWNKNGSAISGATSSSYTTLATTASDSGAQFTVTVTNSVGSVTSNAATLTVTSASSGALNPSTTALSFGNANLGVLSTQTVKFTNAGASNITIANVTFSGASVFSESGVSSGQIVAPGQAATMTVTFVPAAVGLVTGSVTVTSNASNSSITISLSGTGVQGVSNGPGWTYLQDVITTGGGGCVGGSSSCSIGAAMLPTTAGSVLVVIAKTGNGASISSVSGGGTWTHCATCHVNDATIGLDASYSLNVPAGTTSITVNLSSAASGFFQVTVYELLPPSGSTASLDAAGTASDSSCTSCGAVGLTLGGTDAIIQIQAGASVAGWDAWSSPYLTDAHGNGLYLNATGGSAPTMKATSSTNVVFIGMAFKSSLGSFTPPGQAISLVNYAVFPATSGSSVTCSPTCTLNVPATGANHLLYIQAADETGSFISAVSGGGTGWVIPSGCAIKISSGSSSGGALSCAYLLSSTAGATSISVTMTGNPTSGAFAVWELGGGNGSFALDGAPGSATRAGYPATTAGGVGLTLTGTDDVIFQAALIEGGSTGVTLYPVPYINGQAQNFFNNAALQSALLNTTNGTAPIWINGGQNSAIVVTGIAFQLSNASALVLNPSTTSLDFSNVNVGSNSVLPVTFTNASNSSVTISSSSGVTVSGAGYSASGIQSGQIIPAGQTATLNVTFAPAATGTVSGSVTVASDATNSPDSIALSGNGVAVVSHSVGLSWIASASANVAGYNTYSSTVSGGPYTKLNASLVPALSYTDSAVQAGQTYYYVVTAVDSSNMESAYSGEAATTVP